MRRQASVPEGVPAKGDYHSEAIKNDNALPAQDSYQRSVSAVAERQSRNEVHLVGMYEQLS